jgi:hypothetical protein
VCVGGWGWGVGGGGVKSDSQPLERLELAYARGDRTGESRVPTEVEFNHRREQTYLFRK